MVGTIKRWWYGPIYRADPVDNSYYIAPMVWDLADLDRVRAALGQVGATRLQTFSGLAQVEVEPSSIAGLGPQERLNLQLTADAGDGTVVSLALNDSSRSTLRFTPRSEGRTVDVRRTLNALMIDLESRSARRVPLDRRISHWRELLTVVGIAVAVWALVAAWRSSIPLAVLLFLLTVAVARSAWMEAQRLILTHALGPGDGIMIKMTTRSEGDLAWEVRRRERHARMWTAVIAVSAAAVSAIVTVLIRGGK